MVAIPSRSSGWSSTLRIRILRSALIAVILTLPATGESLNPGYTISQYGHSSWTLREAELAAYPRALAQTRDGYLWLGTNSGLLRFDGVRFVSSPVFNTSLPSPLVTVLMAASDGSLWIGTADGLARLANGAIAIVDSMRGRHISALLQARDGTVWAGTATRDAAGLLCSVAVPTTRCQGTEGTFGRYVSALLESEDGDLWIGASTGLHRWSDEVRERFVLPEGAQEIHALIGYQSSVMISLSRNMFAFRNGRFRRFDAANVGGLKPTAILLDRDGTLWIGTQDQGLVRIRGASVERFGRINGLSSDFVGQLLEDREGNIWVGTPAGLDRFREDAVTRVSRDAEAFSGRPALAVQAARDGGVWVATVAGLFRWLDGQLRKQPLSHAAQEGGGSLLEDSRGQLWLATPRGVLVLSPKGGPPRPVELPLEYAHVMVEDQYRRIWISYQRTGLVRVSPDGTIQVTPWSVFGGREARVLAPEATGLWLGFMDGGVAHWADGRVDWTVDRKNDLPAVGVNGLHAVADGLWVATQRGLSFVSASGDARSMDGLHGLPCTSMLWVIEDATRDLWVHSPCGLMRIRRHEVERWLTAPDSQIAFTLYDASDGVPLYADLGGYAPKVTRTSDGRIWLATYDGVAVIDPARLPLNAVPPPVQIESITADNRPYAPLQNLVLPAQLRDIRIDFTALSLVAPEKIRFRYRLDGRDHDWVEAGGRREAFYTDLPHGRYRFHVVAANNQGLWNEDGAAVAFSITPAWHQTSAWRALAVAVASLFLYGIYRLRANAIALRLQGRFEERLRERTRIAQDLHDTLLQDVISCSLHLHLLVGELRDDSVRAKLERVIQRITVVVDEGRRTVVGLRTSAPDDLESALLLDAEQFRNEQPVDVRAFVNGERRPMSPAIRDAVYQIGREALANVFRHGKASRVELELEYAPTALTLVVRDNGCGIEQKVLDSGRSGHWGLHNIRERAAQIEGQLKILSRQNGGTELRLTVAGATAYATPARTTWLRWLRGRMSGAFRRRHLGSPES